MGSPLNSQRAFRNFRAAMKLTSTQNPRVKQIRKLMRLKKERRRQALFIVEGTQETAMAVESGWNIEALLFDPDEPLTSTALKVVQETPAAARMPVSRKIAAYLSDRPNAPELIAVVECRRLQPPQAADAGSLFLLLDHPRDPGNVGSIVRSADAMGIDAVGLSGDAVDIYAPKTTRAAMGSLFCVPTFHLANADAARRWIRQLKSGQPDLRVIGTDPRAEKPVDEIDWTVPAVVVIGNERKGMSAELAEMCDAAASIPMRGSAESLNSAVSASIVMYEAQRQRLRGANS